MDNTAVVSLSIGLSIVIVTLVLFVYSGGYKTSKNYINNNQFQIKKWVYITLLLATNVGLCTIVYYFNNHRIIIYIILALKSRDIISSVLFVFNNIYKHVFQAWRRNEVEVVVSDEFEQVVAFIPVYSESKDQVDRTVDSIIKNKQGQNQLLLCIVCDGNQRYFVDVDDKKSEIELSYDTWHGKNVSANIQFGFVKGAKTIIITKQTNQGKKDSVITVNDIFNYPRENMPESLMNMRNIIRKELNDQFSIDSFNYLLCTDADTILSDNTIVTLIDSIKRRDAIACCGLVNVDLSNGNDIWNNIQIFQYMYGQYMRRSLEDMFNQVSCLPGCITMLSVQEEVSEAMTQYSTLPDETNVVETCVQYLGTDRRLTKCLLSSGDSTRVVFDDRCNAYTMTPSNLNEYVSQRKRWTSNMYFNSLTYIVGKNMNIALRFFSCIEFLRLSLVYFRLFNTLFLFYILATRYHETNIVNLIPFIVIVSYPLVCFFVYSLCDSNLRTVYFRLFSGLIVNKFFTFISSVLVFTSMIWSMGTMLWSVEQLQLEKQECKCKCNCQK